jgi:hypothetical protein
MKTQPLIDTARARVEAQHFALGTASLSILGHDPHHPEVAVIASWNAASSAKVDPLPLPSEGDAKIVNPRALERWENEGGAITLGAVPARQRRNEG